MKCAGGWPLTVIALACMAVSTAQAQGATDAHATTASQSSSDLRADASPVTPQDLPAVDKAPRDVDFGVSTRHVGLQRHVEMLQWARSGQAYDKVWSDTSIESSGFAPGHENPRALPLQHREWRASVSVDGKPLAPELVAQLGVWRAIRPNFSDLPGNMSATFQPEGEGLGSAENPLAPQVGDLRITWSALELPALDDRLVLRDGRWQMLRIASNASLDDQAEGRATSLHAMSPWLAFGAMSVAWKFTIAAMLLALFALVVVALRRRR